MSFREQFFSQITGPAEGRKWVFLHGLMGFANNWRKVISQLEATENCLAFDQRGHGRSIKPEFGYSPEDYANDLLKIINELGWNDVILVGHSMGGRNALNFASRFAEKLSHLIIVDIGPEGIPQASNYYKELLGIVPTPFDSREKAKAFFKGEFLELAKTREKPEVLANYFYANMIDTDAGVDWRFSKKGILDSVAQGREKDRWDEVDQIRTKTLWIRGGDSLDLSEEIFQRVLSRNSLIRGVTIPGAGHWVHADQPQLFVDELKNFVGGF